MGKYLNRHERCRECYHLESCDAWVKHAIALYDDFITSVTSLPADYCPYYMPKILPGQPGHWIKDQMLGYEPHYNCSVCTGISHQDFDYCCHCGAKMDGKVVDLCATE